MKSLALILAFSFSFSAFAFNCKKECKEENKQCQILVKESNAQLVEFHRALPYDRATLRKKLKEVKAKKKEELSYCKELRKDCYQECRE